MESRSQVASPDAGVRAIGDKVLDRYVVRQKLGGGAMGVVFKAFDERLRCDVALKFLLETNRFDEKARARFLREGRALARIRHPAICTVRDFLDEAGTDILVMEFVEGQTLDRRLANGPLPERDVVRLGLQLAEGLGAAHAAGVLHRDLKPANIGLSPNGCVKILDFGLAKMMPGVGGVSVSISTTDTIEVRGTLPYIAPELLKGGVPDAASDVYSLGCVLYEMATSRRAFPEEDGLRLWHAILNASPTPPRRVAPRLSVALERVILGCLEKEPRRRYVTTAELERALRSLLPGGWLSDLRRWWRR